MCSSDDCEVTPDSQKITWYRVEFCTSKPTGPTPSTTIDRSSCSTFYQNDNGSEVSIVQGVGTQIGSASDYTAVPYGTYSYGIITLGSTFKFTSSVTFDGIVKDGGSGDGSTTCVTKASTLGILYGFHTVSNFDEGNIPSFGEPLAALSPNCQKTLK